MRCWTLLQIVALSTALFAGSACRQSDADDGNGEGGEGEDGESAWILGTWSGTFKSKSADADSPLRETTTAVATFSGEDFTGDFVISLPDLDDVYARGTFTDFARTSLMLNVRDSKLSSLGLVGSKTDLDYELVGNALELRNDRVLLRLIRDKAPAADDGEGDGGASPASNKALGRFHCTDDDGGKWDLRIKDGGTFTAYIDQTLYMDGSAAFGDPDFDAVLTVQSSNDKGTVGLVMGIKVFNDVDMTMTLNGRQTACRRSL